MAVTESGGTAASRNGGATLTAHPMEPVIDRLADCHTLTFEFVKRNRSCLRMSSFPAVSLLYVLLFPFKYCPLAAFSFYLLVSHVVSIGGFSAPVTLCLYSPDRKKVEEHILNSYLSSSRAGVLALWSMPFKLISHLLQTSSLGISTVGVEEHPEQFLVVTCMQ